MPRRRIMNFDEDGVQAKLAGMVGAEVDDWLEQNNKLVNADPPTPKEAFERMARRLTFNCLVWANDLKADLGANDDEVEKILRREFSTETLNALFLKAMQVCGIKPAAQGEAKAA